MIAGTSTFDDEMAAAARRGIAHVVKMRARRYRRDPRALDALFSGLGCASAETLVAVAIHLVEREACSPRRWFGFGGEVGLLNARAALLLGRALRRCRAATKPASSGPPS